MRDRDEPIEQVRRLAPVDRHRLVSSWSDSEAKQALFQEITAMPIDTDMTPATRKTRVRRPALVLAATVATMGLATAGAAWLGSGDVADTTSVGCHTPDNGVAVVDSTSGDPVADCTSLWSDEYGQVAPDLIAYDNGIGGIEVVPATETVPDNWEPLEPGLTQDPRLIELEAALDDIASGLRSDCLGPDEASRIVGRELGRLGLQTWSIVTERGEADGANTCSYFAVRPATQDVAIIPIEGLVAPDGDPMRQYAHSLAETLDEQCLTTAEAAVVAADLATNTDVSGINVHEVADPDAECARVHVNVGGSVEVTIRGPRSQ